MAVDDNSNSSSVRDARLLKVIAECMQRQDRGESIDRLHLLRENPEIAEGLLQYFNDLDSLERQIQANEPIPDRNASAQDSVSFTAGDQSTDHELPLLTDGPVSETRVLPQQIGRYQVLCPLGQGGMGTVFLVLDPKLHRQVALKLPRISGPDKSAVHARFLVEAKAAARLSHQHICRIYDFGEIDGTPFYTMEYIEGTPLSQKCPATGFANITEAVAIVRCVADAMSEAHSKGLIHRDLKPSNIVLDERGIPIVVDFGLAREILRPSDSSLTEMGTIVGTIGYMSPEQISGRKSEIGAQSDIWSLGIILHELLTGRQPFVGSQTDIVAQILRDDPPRLSNLRPDTPPALDAICVKMLEKKTSNRYSTMAEVVAALDVFLNSRGWRGYAQPRSPSPESPKVSLESTLELRTVPPPSPEAPDRKRKRSKVPAIAASLLLAAGVVLAVIVVRIHGAPQTVELHLDDEILKDNELTVEIGDSQSTDGTAIHKEDTSIKLKVGTYEIRVLRGPDNIIKKQRVQVRRGEDNIVRLTIGDPPAPAPGTIERFPLDPDWRKIEVPYERAKEIVGLGFDPNSRSLIIALPDRVEIYDPYTKAVWAALPLTGKSEVHGFAASRDGRFAAVVFDESIEVFNMNEQKLMRQFARTKENKVPSANSQEKAQLTATTAAFSDDAKLAAPTDGDTITIWNIENGAVIQTIHGRPGVGAALALSPDGSLLAIRNPAEDSAYFAVLNVSTKKEQVKVFERSIRDAAFTPDGKHFLTSTSDGTATVWNVGNGEKALPPFLHGASITSFAVSSSGRHAITGSQDRTFQVWDLSTGKSIYSSPAETPVNNVAVSPDGTFVAAATDNMLQVVALPATLTVGPGQSGLVASLFHPHNALISATALSPNGRLYAAAGRTIGTTEWDKERNSMIAVWDLGTRSLLKFFDAGDDPVGRVRFTPDSSTLVSRSSGSIFRFWNVATGELVPKSGFRGFNAGIIGQGISIEFEFLPNGDLVLVGEQGLQIVNGNSLAVKAQWAAPIPGGFRSVAPIPDRMEVLTSTHKLSRVSRWTIGNAKRIEEWKTNGIFAVDSIRISSSGQTALTGSMGAFEVWNLADPKDKPMVLIDNTSTGLRLTNQFTAVNSDGTRVLLGSNAVDSEVYLFDTASGKVVGTFKGRYGENRSADFSSDDRFAICAGGEGAVRIWALPQAPDSDRAVAEWVLSKGGRLGIEYKRELRRTRLKDKAELNDDPFWVWDIDLHDIRGIPSAEFSRISGLTRLYQINLTNAEFNDEGMAAMNSLPTLTTLELNGTGITDASMKAIARFPNLVTLQVARTQISNTFASQLLAFPQLEHLDLSDTKIDDGAAPFLRGLQKLQMLNLSRTQVTDKSLEQFATLRRLVNLSCTHTGVTADGVKTLKQELPQLNIESDKSP